MDLFIFLGQRGRRLSRVRKVCAVSGTPGVPWGQPGTSQAGSRLGFCKVDESISHFDYMKVRAFSAYKDPFSLKQSYRGQRDCDSSSLPLPLRGSGWAVLGVHFVIQLMVRSHHRPLSGARRIVRS